MGGRHQLLRTLVAADIARDGEMSSTMVRAGLLRDILDEHAELLEAAQKALNFIANTEGELGITLDSGDALRAAIAKATGPRAHSEDIDRRGE